MFLKANTNVCCLVLISWTSDSIFKLLRDIQKTFFKNEVFFHYEKLRPPSPAVIRHFWNEGENAFLA